MNMKKIAISLASAIMVFGITAMSLSSTIKANNLPEEETIPTRIECMDDLSAEDTTTVVETCIVDEPNVKSSAPGRDIDTLAMSHISEEPEEESDDSIQKGIDEGVYPTCPFIEAIDTSRVVWYTGNMKLCSKEISTNDYQYTQEDLDWLAKIMHCEICDQGSEARRAVGTVVMNRVEWNECPDTILGVISQDNQFSPWGNGEIFDAEPCEYCKEAAIDVLVNGYRAFPREVRYFQSIEDGYFEDKLTYAYFKESGFNTWFSFSMDDVEDPNID